MQVGLWSRAYALVNSGSNVDGINAELSRTVQLYGAIVNIAKYHNREKEKDNVKQIGGGFMTGLNFPFFFSPLKFGSEAPVDGG